MGGIMKNFKGHFSSLRLGHKFTVLIIATIVFPMIVLSILFFENIRNSKIEEKMNNVEVNFAQNYNQIQKKVEVCLMSTQVVINSENFWNNVVKFSTEDNIDPKELIYFYKNDITGLEKLVNSNPYLYQIRVYVDSDKLQEMMPILYNKERMDRLSWANDRDFQSGTWQFDYTDSIFPFNRKPAQHLVSYVTSMKDLDHDVKAIIEISTKMELLFPDLYTSTEEEWTCFVDGNGYYYYNTDYYSRWLKSVNNVYKNIPKKLENSFSEQIELDGVPVIVCYKPLKELNGHLIKIVSLEDDIASVNQTRNIFWISFFCIVLLLIIFTDKIVDIILKQFYAIM